MVFDLGVSSSAQPRKKDKAAQCGCDSLTVSLDLHSTGQRLRAQTKVEASDTIYEIQRRVARVVRPQSFQLTFSQLLRGSDQCFVHSCIQ